MSDETDDEPREVNPGQIWKNSTYEFEVLVTRVSDVRVHLDYPGEEAKEQAQAVQEMAEEQFDHPFVHISPIMGTVKETGEFREEYSFVKMRELEPHES